MRKEDELSNEIQRLISLLVQQHVKSWYSSVSRDIELFGCFAMLTEHIQTALSIRAECVNWHQFILQKAPKLLVEHLDAVNKAIDQHGVDGFEENLISTDGHPGVQDSQNYLAHVAEGLLALLLPADELGSDIAHEFTRELLADLILRTVVERLSEPWFWDEILIKVDHGVRKEAHSVWSNILLFDKLKAVFKTLYVRIARIRPMKEWMSASEQASEVDNSIYDSAYPALLQQLLAQSDLPATSTLVTQLLLPLIDFISGRSLMRIARHKIDDFTTQTSLAKLVRVTRRILFPQDIPTPDRVLPSVTEQAAMKAAAQDLLPPGLQLPFMSRKKVNKALVLKMLDLVLSTLFPELTTRTPAQLSEKALAIAAADLEAVGHRGIRSRPINSNLKHRQLQSATRATA